MKKDIKTTNFSQNPVGFLQKLLGFSQNPVGFLQKLPGFSQNPAGFLQKLLGFSQNPVGFLQKSPRFFILVALISLTTSCRDSFGDINSPANQINDADPVRLFTEALTRMDNSAYGEWFYNYSYYMKWAQVTVTEGGNPSGVNQVSGTHASQNNLLIPKLQIEEIRYLLRSRYSAAEAAPYRYLEAVCNPVLVYLGLQGTDMYGSLPYTEASTARHTSPAITTPRYETQQELFKVWLAELDETIATLTAPVTLNGNEVTQIAPGAQDLIYNGDWKRWARLANSLKLRIAVRMLHMDRAQALKIAEEVAASPAGLMTETSHDMIYTIGAQHYRITIPIENAGIGSAHLVDFLRHNLDPRLRFFFAKNNFTGSIVQAFFDAGRPVPPYILDLVEYTETADGQKTFRDWKAPGEPWVRYHGAPVDIQARHDAELNNNYFNVENFRLPSGGGTKTYQPLSLYNEEMVRGNVVHTFPTVPGGAVLQDNEAHQWYGAFYSSAEANLYLAEFALLGANLPETADVYYNRGIELSVRLFDRLAAINHIPYYDRHTGFDATDRTIALTEEEIAPLLTRYTLSGSAEEQLEQVYIQQYIHHIYQPQEMFVTFRRSGYPSPQSTLFPRLPMNSADDSYPIPRRLPVPALDPTDGMYEIKKAAFAAEGFTAGSNAPAVLERERVDYDK